MISPQIYKQALGRFASGVTIVVLEEEGRLMGFTASSFCSLSLEPPLVLVCLGRGSECHTPLTQIGRRFTVQILGDDQVALAYAFADGVDDKSGHAPWALNERGFAIVEATPVVLECRLEASHPGGDHDILVGRVEAATLHEDRPPLLYYRGQLGGMRFDS